jgi:hydroxyacylglutathione hydrolase
MKVMKTWKTKSGQRIIRVLSGRSNVFLVSNGEKNMLVDTSVNRNWMKLKKRLDYLQVNEIHCLVLTHAHFDHVDNAYRIKERYKSLVFIHKNEAINIISGSTEIPEGTNLFTRFMTKQLAPVIAPVVRCKPCQPDVQVDAICDLKDHGFHAYIMHTPGHSSGSMSVIVDDEMAIVGDAMFGVFKGSVFPPFAANIVLMVKSWGKLLDTNCSVFLPSHGSANSRELVQKEFNKWKT